MKKRTKVVVIVAVLMIVVGIGLCAGGVMAAGGVRAVNEVLRNNGINVVSGYEFSIDEAGIEFDLAEDSHSEQSANHHADEAANGEIYHDSEGTTASEKQQYSAGEAVTYGTEDVKSLKLDIKAKQADIVETSSATEISVQTDGKYDIYVKNGVLHVKAKGSSNNHTMVVEIPENAVFENVEISVGACELNIQRIEAKEFDLEAGAAQAKLESLVADKAEFEIGAGEIIVDDGTVQECDVSVGMGNFEYNGEITKRGDIECGMGNAELYLEGCKEDYNYEIECAAGNVTIDDEDFSGLSTEHHMNHQAETTIEIECSMGNVTVGF